MVETRKTVDIDAFPLVVFKALTDAGLLAGIV
jgi:hypothetical protein